MTNLPVRRNLRSFITAPSWRSGGGQLVLMTATTHTDMPSIRCRDVDVFFCWLHAFLSDACGVGFASSVNLAL